MYMQTEVPKQRSCQCHGTKQD